MGGGSKLGWIGAAALAVLAATFAACGGTGEAGTTNGNNCVPGATQACVCGGGLEGVQVCSDDGARFEACDCGQGNGGSGSTGTGTSSGGGGSGGSGSSTSTGTAMGACGDGIESPGECDPGSELYCPADCESVNPCEGVVTYAGMIANVGSVWAQAPNSGGATGIQAGNNACLAIGAEHVCDYEEIVKAAANNELAGIPAGTTAWLHRTTTVDNLPAGAASRCNDWAYGTDHIADGEFITFEAAGVPTYQIDPDLVNTSNSAYPCQGDVGGPKRAILCCFPACAP